MPPMQRINQMTPFQRDLMKLFRGDDDYDLAQFLITYQEQFTEDFRECLENGLMPKDEELRYDSLLLYLGLNTLGEFMNKHINIVEPTKPPTFKKGDLVSTPGGAAIVESHTHSLVKVRVFSNFSATIEYPVSCIDMPTEDQIKAFELIKQNL